MTKICGFILQTQTSEVSFEEMEWYINLSKESLLINTFTKVDEHGNITQDKKRTVFIAKQKLPPIKEGVEPNVQRLVAPYRNNKSKATLSKLSKYPSAPQAPQKRVSLIEQYNLAPKKSQTLLLKPKVLASTRKVQPLTKEQLEQVFAKYQIKTVSKKDKIDNESVTAEERSTDCKDRRSESSPEKVQPQNEISQDFAVKKLDFVVEPTDGHEEENPEEEMKVDAREEMVMREVVMTEPAVPLAPDHIEESNENVDKVRAKEEEEEENFIQIIDNEKAIDNADEEFNHHGPKNHENEEENEANEPHGDECLADGDKGNEVEITRKSDVFEKKHTTTPIILPDSPEQNEEEEANNNDNMMKSSNVKEAEKAEKAEESDVEEYNLSLLDEM